MQRRVRGQKRVNPHKSIGEATRPLGIKAGVELSRDQIFNAMWWHRPVGEESSDELGQLAGKLAAGGLVKAKKKFTFTIVNPRRVMNRLDGAGVNMTSGQLERLKILATSRQPVSLDRDVEAEVIGLRGIGNYSSLVVAYREYEEERIAMRDIVNDGLDLPNSRFYYNVDTTHVHLAHGIVTRDQLPDIPKTIILGPLSHGCGAQNVTTA